MPPDTFDDFLEDNFDSEVVREIKQSAARNVLDFIKTLPQEEQDAIEDQAKFLCQEAGISYTEFSELLDNVRPSVAASVKQSIEENKEFFEKLKD